MANYPNLPEKNNWFEDYGYAVMILGFVALAIIIAIFATVQSKENKDLGSGVVFVEGTSIYKVCDGSNLIIQGRSTVVIQNSRECI